jgi:hypothetical protein
MKAQEPLNYRNDELELEFDVCGSSPVQAFGTVAGRDLYFRARHNDWEFEIANEHGDLPTDVDDRNGFVRRGKIKGASDIPYAKAAALIEACVREYLGRT